MKNQITLEMTKNVILITMLFSATMSTTSCDFFKLQKPTQISKKCLVIVKDESASIEEDASDIEKQKLWIKNYLHVNFQEETDILLLSVNANSNSAINHQNLMWKKSADKSVTVYESETDQLLYESKKSMENRFQIKKLQKQLLDKLFNKTDVVKSNQTQIIELLPQIDRLTKNHTEIKILLLTDGFQESSLRSFGVTYPNSKKRAEEFAKADAKKIINLFGINNSVLKNVNSIQVLVPPKTNAQKLEITPYYFKQFFSCFAYTGDIEWTSI